MGSWQSAVNVSCCTTKNDDSDSDGERAEVGHATDKAKAVCVVRPLPWNENDTFPAPSSCVNLPRSISQASTVIPLRR